MKTVIAFFLGATGMRLVGFGAWHHFPVVLLLPAFITVLAIVGAVAELEND